MLLSVKSKFENIKNEEGQTFYSSGDFARILIFVIVSFVGTFFYPPLLFIHLIDIVCNSPTLANLFEAIALGVKSLFFVSLLGVVFTVVFCTVTFTNYLKNVYEDAGDDMC